MLAVSTMRNDYFANGVFENRLGSQYRAIESLAISLLNAEVSVLDNIPYKTTTAEVDNLLMNDRPVIMKDDLILKNDYTRMTDNLIVNDFCDDEGRFARQEGRFDREGDLIVKDRLTMMKNDSAKITDDLLINAFYDDEGRFGDHEGRFDGQEGRFAYHEGRFDEGRFDREGDL